MNTIICPNKDCQAQITIAIKHTQLSKLRTGSASAEPLHNVAIQDFTVKCSECGRIIQYVNGEAKLKTYRKETMFALAILVVSLFGYILVCVAIWGDIDEDASKVVRMFSVSCAAVVAILYGAYHFVITTNGCKQIC